LGVRKSGGVSGGFVFFAHATRGRGLYKQNIPLLGNNLLRFFCRMMVFGSGYPDQASTF
jgi:hypothetical protein